MSGYGIPEPPLDPPDDPPLVTCPDCEGLGYTVVEIIGDEGPELDREPCEPCEATGERYLTDEEVRDARAEAAIERAEARRDDDL